MKLLLLVIVFYGLSFEGYSQCQATFASNTIATCDTLISPGNQILTESGTFYDTLVNSAGCDSVITTNLTIHQSAATTIFVSTCGNPYTSNGGISYGSTGLYAEFYSTTNGCDSTVYIDIEIGLHSDYALRIVEGCGQFISDADSVYTESGFYYEPEIEPTGSGCFSYIPYQVTIINVDPEVFFIDQMTLKATDQGTAFQWVDCNNNYAPIAGDTNQIFTANVNGDYACIVAVNSCSDTSDCFRIGSLSIAESAQIINHYPNPTTGLVNIDLENLKNVSIEVFNITGKQVYSAKHIHSSNHQFELNQPAGVYLLELHSEHETKRVKLVIE